MRFRFTSIGLAWKACAKYIKIKSNFQFNDRDYIFIEFVIFNRSFFAPFFLPWEDSPK